MKLVDANVLLYVVNEDTHHHTESRTWLDRALAGAEAVAFPWVCVLAFIRLSTQPRIFDRPLSAAEALFVVESWLAQPVAVTLDPTPRHIGILRGLLEEAGTAGNLTTDAHLAALATEHGATIVSFDTDFARFRGVRSQRPGESA